MRVRMPRAGDALIAVGLFAIALIGLYEIGSDARPEVTPKAIVLIALMTLPLAWRHRAPRTILWVSILAWMIFVAIGYPNAASILGLVVALYGVGLYLPRRSALLHGIGAILVVSAWTAMGVLTSDNVQVAAVISTLVALVIALGIGLSDNRRHLRLTELEIAHARQDQARKNAAADAVRAERARIARELHDVVAHEVTVMTLQAEGAARLAKDGDPRVAEALHTISESGRTGLMEMQRMIGVLRASEAEAAEGVTGRATLGESDDAAAEHHTAFDLLPMPSLAALPDLVQQVEDAGLPVSLEVSGSAHVPAGVELSAFRVVQESLTNAMKHAGPGANATVAVVREADAVTITVEDDGRGVISEAMHSGGHGIDGMRERITALGGTLDVGPRSGGGYRVHAVLPSGDDQVHSTRPRSATPITPERGRT
ncbi:sensor histidine kinase [Demequina aurantiaca]|uniref:sensor histidine kinase n=1 Tax=Demequina aurantiaca TaxID=676200 RepID=UPI00128D8381|nr:histidine kinase [Demequina aurantiaca]